MKNIPGTACLLVALWLLLPALPGRAGEKWHVGLMAGTPTGISLARPLTGGALNFGAGWNLTGDGFVHVHADYVRNLKIVIDDSWSLPAYYGVGAVLRIGREGGLGARVPLGLLYRLKPHPLEVFAEVAPAFYLLPGTRFDVMAAIGVRYIWP